jgi:uncharacterized protein (TIGR02246 family)
MLGGLVAIPTPTQTTLSQPDDEQAIRRLTKDWLAAVRAKDIARLTDMVTEDAVFLPPGLPPVRGKQAVAAMYASFFPQFSSVEQTVSMEEIQVTGDWAFTWGGERFVLVPRTGGPPIQMEGKGMSILRRQPGASWRFARGINNTLPRSAP